MVDPATQAVSCDRETWRAVTIKPGDRILVITSSAVTVERALKVQAELGRRFPGVEFTVMDSVTGLARMEGEVDHVE